MKGGAYEGHESLKIVMMKGVLAIRRVFSLVDMITNTKLSNCPNVFKIVWFVSKICIVNIKKCSKAIHHSQSLGHLCFLLPPLILRLYTGCRLDQTLSKCLVSFSKVKVLKSYG